METSEWINYGLCVRSHPTKVQRIVWAFARRNVLNTYKQFLLYTAENAFENEHCVK